MENVHRGGCGSAHVNAKAGGWGGAGQSNGGQGNGRTGQWQGMCMGNGHAGEQAGQQVEGRGDILWGRQVACRLAVVLAMSLSSRLLTLVSSLSFLSVLGQCG